MGYYAVDDETEDLQHHGILGMKWGVRRFQRKDGTRTPAGKARERARSSGDDQNDANKQSINGKTVAKVALGTAAVVGAGALAYHYATMPKEYRAMINACGKVGLKDLGAVAKKRAIKVGDRMLTAALASVGTIAISKVAKALKPADDASQFEKDVSKIATDAVSAGIREAIGGNNSNYSNQSNNSNKSQSNSNSSGKVDTDSQEYQNLFNGLDNKSDRDAIRQARKEGKTMEELRVLRDSLGHSEEFEQWDKSFTLSEFRW